MTELPDSATMDAIRQLLGSYAQTVDDGRWETFALLWTEDAEAQVFDDRIVGRTAIIEWMQVAQPPEARGRHLLLNTVVTHADQDRIATTSDFVFLKRDEKNWLPSFSGRYHDVFVRTPDGWRFREHHIEMR